MATVDDLAGEIISEDFSDDPNLTSAGSSVSRNLLTSVMLLIAVILVGTLSVRDLELEGVRPERQCPLTPWVRSVPSGKSDKAETSLDDHSLDWDRILLSSKYDIVFDPMRLKIDSLLALPPPTFKSKVDLASATMNYIHLIQRIGNGRKYISVSE